jgi:transcriptional regulator with XRE-family HTH domain
MAHMTTSIYASETLLALQRLGARIREARVHRRLRQQDVAEKARVSRGTIEAVESGEPGTSIGTYIQVLWVLGLDRELELVADPGIDREGLALTYSSTDKRVRPARRIRNDF